MALKHHDLRGRLNQGKQDRQHPEDLALKMLPEKEKHPCPYANAGRQEQPPSGRNVRIPPVGEAGARREEEATHSVSSVVLPKPAGAATRVREYTLIRWSRSSRRLRTNLAARTSGGASFVVSSGGVDGERSVDGIASSASEPGVDEVFASALPANSPATALSRSLVNSGDLPR